MTHFVHDWPAIRVVFGEGAAGSVGEEASRLGSRLLLVTGRRVHQSVTDGLDAFVGTVVHHVDDPVMHVPASLADAVVEVADRTRADVVVSVGGGSATGLAKAVAKERRLPVVAVPTTYAGSEVTSIWGLTREGRKVTGRDPSVLPRTVIYDPLLTLGMPSELTAASGLNAMAHAVEALYAPDPSPLALLGAEDSIRLLAEALPVLRERPDDLARRTDALRGAWQAGWALNTATMGVHHRICHVLGGRFDLPHAQTHAQLLPYAVAFNAAAAPAAMARVAAAMAVGDPAPALYELRRALGLPGSLLELGFPPDQVTSVAEEVAASAPVNPRPVTVDGVRQVLDAAVAGEPPAPA
jgi:maleylacetate reductase